MKLTDTSEAGLETLICRALTGSDCAPRSAGAPAFVAETPAPYGGVGWLPGDPADYDREYCVDLAQLAAFLRSTQPKVAEALDLDNDSPTRRKFLARLQDEVSKRGVVLRGKALFRCIDVRSQTGQEELLTVSSERGVVPRRSANVTMFKAESYVGYKLCWPDDLVINSLWAWARGLGMSPYHGKVSSAYGVYRLRNRQQDNPRFIHQLVRSTPFQWELQVRSKGIWVSRLQLTDDAFLGAPFPTPPSNEQTAIVRFLDYMERRVRRYIRAKQKLVKLLEEYRQALIHRAVTGKIDARTGQPYPAYKPSGVEWLGDVPAHWEVRRTKTLFKSRKQLNTDGSETNVLSLTLRGMVNNDPDNPEGLVPKDYKTYQIFERDDLVFKLIDLENVQTSRVGLVHERGIMSPAYVRLTLSDVGKFGFITGNSTTFIRDLSTINSERGYALQLDGLIWQTCAYWLPPLPEQTAIVEYLDAQTAKIDSATSAARREIELLREYLTRLIADVVTGKVDVREVAAQLPEEPPEEEAELMDTEEIAEGEGADEESGAEALSEEVEP